MNSKDYRNIREAKKILKRIKKKFYDSQIESSFAELKRGLQDILSLDIEDVKNDEGKFIRSEVKEALSNFEEFNRMLKDFESDVSEHAEKFGVYYKGPYGVTTNLRDGDYDE
tara:strand:+ start:6171 stop:6506 length:336 start_codon:yes stop_codon:yes gene_type:complete